MENNIVTYPKLDEDEVILPGDLVELDDEEDKVFLAQLRGKHCQNNIIGICSEVNDNIITVVNTGIVDVNTTGIICVGDKLTISEKPGKLTALKYEQNINTFKAETIGKVIGLYQHYGIAKVLLQIN